MFNSEFNQVYIKLIYIDIINEQWICEEPVQKMVILKKQTMILISKLQHYLKHEIVQTKIN